ncbi:hypothetical protein [Pedosphaera parvula]|nr:hypothetical protein [Pedosphaera parvula]
MKSTVLHNWSAANLNQPLDKSRRNNSARKTMRLVQPTDTQSLPPGNVV